MFQRVGVYFNESILTEASRKSAYLLFFINNIGGDGLEKVISTMQ